MLTADYPQEDSID